MELGKEADVCVFLDVAHIQMNDITVNRHLAQICGQVGNAELRHAPLYQLRILLGHDEFHPDGLLQ